MQKNGSISLIPEWCKKAFNSTKNEQKSVITTYIHEKNSPPLKNVEVIETNLKEMINNNFKNILDDNLKNEEYTNNTDEWTDHSYIYTLSNTFSEQSEDEQESEKSDSEEYFDELNEILDNCYY